MVNREQRTFVFSNGAEASATIMGGNKFVTLNGQTFPFPNMTLGARQGILNAIYSFTGWESKKAKVVRESYVCEITIPDKQIVFEVKASPNTAAYTFIEVYYDGEVIFKGREKVTFNSIKTIQNLALEKVMHKYAQKQMQKKPEEKKEEPKKEEKPKKKEVDPKLDKRIVSILDFLTKLGVSYSGEPIYLESGYQEYCSQGNFNITNKTESYLRVYAKVNIFALDLLYQLNDFESYDYFKAISELTDGKKFSLAIIDERVNQYKHKVRFFNGLNLVANFSKSSNSPELTKVLLLCNFGRNQKQELIKRALKGEI